MIVFDLVCDNGHGFEGWFGSSTDYTDQCASGLVACPQCGSAIITKAPMAPAVPRKGNRQAASASPTNRAADPGQTPVPIKRPPLPAPVVDALAKLARAQNEALRNSRWVGTDFSETSRAMHYGERAEEPIHGRASPEEARALVKEGIRIAPLPFPLASPDDLN